MPNYLINYEATAPQDSVDDALTSLEAILERYPNGMTIYERDVLSINRDRQKSVGWIMFDGQYARLFDDAFHLHEADNIILI